MGPARDTIVAVSSPPGRSPRGLVRLAGPGAALTALSLLEPPAPPLVPNRLSPVRLAEGRLPALLAFFAAGRSYTADETVELQLPGNPVLLERVIRACLASGARLAEPGEFTFRAFLAGRLDLTQAEGIAATIAATSDSQLRAAGLLRRGKLGGIAGDLVDRLGTQLALVEAGIDFTDQEDVVPIAPSALAENLAGIVAALDSLLTRSRSWGSLETLPRVVLVGPPSSGKSTLFNALLDRERAVVSATPGTTRDVLAEPLTLHRDDGPAVEVMLVDIAGLDDPAASLDRAAQAAARQAVESADLLLIVRDPTRPPQPPLPEPAAAPTLTVATKCDVAPCAAEVAVSARTGAGLDLLRAAIRERVGDRGVALAADTLALRPRHTAALRSAAAHLGAAASLLADQADHRAIEGVELVADHLRRGLDELAGLGGTLTPDDIIGRVFATFCVGK